MMNKTKEVNMRTYKITFTHQDRSLLVKYKQTDMLEFDGELVSKKTYTSIMSLLNSLKTKEYGTSV